MNRPNFFVVGFPKCGTTSLASYLSGHPDILMSKEKEPHYFCFDFSSPTLSKIRTEDAYLKQFDSPGRVYEAIGEASTGYIYSKVAVRNILRFADNPKFVVVVRNPLEIAISAHAEMLQSGHEDVENFPEAWRLSPYRREGRHMPTKSVEKFLVTYQDIGRIGTRLENLLRQIRREALKIIVFDDLRSNPKSVYLDLLEFLGVHDDGRTEFPVLRARRYHRNRVIADFVNRPHPILLRIATFIKSVAGVDRLHVIHRLREWNMEPRDIRLSEEFLEDMRTHYSEEIKTFERIVNRQLGWI